MLRLRYLYQQYDMKLNIIKNNSTIMKNNKRFYVKSGANQLRCLHLRLPAHMTVLSSHRSGLSLSRWYPNYQGTSPPELYRGSSFHGPTFLVFPCPSSTLPQPTTPKSSAEHLCRVDSISKRIGSGPSGEVKTLYKIVVVLTGPFAD